MLFRCNQTISDIVVKGSIYYDRMICFPDFILEALVAINDL